MEERYSRASKHKRKHNTTFAKEKSKKARFTEKNWLNDDTYDYLLRVEKLLEENNFNDEEEKAAFINNVFEEMANEEIPYSRNLTSATILERLLPIANDQVLVRFMNAFDEVLRPMCSDRVASRVLEKLLNVVADKVKVPEIKEEDSTSKYEEWILKIGRFLLNNLEEFVWVKISNHVIRTVLKCLGGISSINSESSSKNNSKNFQGNLDNATAAGKVPSSFVTLLKEYIRRLTAWPQFPDLAYNTITSGLLQSLLFAAKAVDDKLAQKFISKLLDNCFPYEEKTDVEHKKKLNEPQISSVFEYPAAIHLLEAAIAVASRKKLTKIYANCFINNLAALSKHPHANFSVQKLLDHCTEKEEYEQMYNELEDHFEQIFKMGYTGVIWKLAEGCKKHVVKQNSFQNSLMKTLYCFEPRERQIQLVPLTLSLQTFQKANSSSKNNEISINFHGSLIVQTLLYFNKPIKAVNSILEMNKKDTSAVFSHPTGCHIMDAFMKGPYVGEKNRKKMVKKLQGLYLSLARSKYGSRTFEAIWKVASMTQKCNIMDELSNKQAVLLTTEFGNIIASKYNTSLYKFKKELWIESQEKKGHTKKLFADIIGDVK